MYKSVLSLLRGGAPLFLLLARTQLQSGGLHYVIQGNSAHCLSFFCLSFCKVTLHEYLHWVYNYKILQRLQIIIKGIALELIDVKFVFHITIGSTSNLQANGEAQVFT